MTTDDAGREDWSVRKAPADSPDAELIRLCARLVALEAAEAARLNAQGQVADWADALEQGAREWQSVEKRIYAVGGPKTPEGLRAIARALLAATDKRPDGTPAPRDLGSWLAVAAARYITEQPTG